MCLRGTNTMKAATRITLVISGILCFGETGGNSLKLTPYPEALVKEGETLHMQCIYTGLSSPDFINWYLNGDTFGLVIDARNNQIQIQPAVYEPERYTIASNSTIFTLSIANISQAKDAGDQWECDITIIGMQAPSRASTIIRVIQAGTVEDTAERRRNVLPIVLGSLLPVAVLVIIAVSVWVTRITGTCKRDFCNTCQTPSEKHSVNTRMHATVQDEDCHVTSLYRGKCITDDTKWTLNDQPRTDEVGKSVKIV